MQHHAQASPKPIAHICTHPLIPNSIAGAKDPSPMPPRNMPNIQSKAPHMNGNTTATPPSNHLHPYQAPHQTSIQMQKIRQQHQHINYKNNNIGANNNNNLNKNASYNNTNSSSNNNNSHNLNQIQGQQQQHPKHILSRNGNLQQHQQQLQTVAMTTNTVQQQQKHYNNMVHIEHQATNFVKQNLQEHNNSNATLVVNNQQKTLLNALPNNNKIKYNNNHKFNSVHKNCFPHDAYNNKSNNNNNNSKSAQQQNYRNGGKFVRQQQQQEQKKQRGQTINNDSADNSSPNVTLEENVSQNETQEQNEDENNTTEETITNKHDEQMDNSHTKPIDNAGDNNNNILSNEDETVSKNGKEKTPMCLVNELARFNKITHQYRLTSEKGPAHCKRFTVTLKLGEEEYSADGFKIKKAQHMAAAQAIEQTKYKHPIPKTLRRNEENHNIRSNITPTVALNALAMKLGQQTYYLFDPRQMPHQAQAAASPLSDVVHDVNAPTVHFVNHQHNVMPHAPPYIRRSAAGFVPPAAPPFIPTYQPRFGYGRGCLQKCVPRFQPTPLPPPPLPLGAHAPPHFHPSICDRGFMSIGPCKITLIVGQQKFVGTGRTLQQAKHDAAAQALQVLKAQQATQQENILNNSQEESDDKKSPISLVHEIGIKRDLPVRFKVLREEGPAHMRKFITACTVGTIVTEGEGNGKKISKKRAAEKMLVELKKLPPLSPPKSPTRRIKGRTPVKFSLGAVAVTTPKSEKRRRVHIKDKSADNSIAEEENPVTKLLQLQQSRKAAEPVFEIVAKNGSEFARRKDFIVEVTFLNKVARGVGINKKVAKKNAAQNMLDLLNEIDTGSKEDSIKVSNEEKSINDEQVASIEHGEQEKSVDISVVNNTNTKPATTKKDPFNLPIVETTAGQIPGILILRPNKKNHLKKKISSTSNSINNDQETTTTTNSNNNNDNVPYNITTTTTNYDTAATTTKITNESVTTTTNAITTPVDNKIETNSSENRTTNKSVGANSIMKEQLLYLSKLMDFEVCFNDYPKGGSHSDFLTIVTLSTDPPQICHGTGSNSEESQNDAARNALKILSELGLSSAKK